MTSKISAVLGAQWGDEGKGKLIDLIATNYSAVGRCAGGNNAGHTIVVPDRKDPSKQVKCDFHLLPSGLAHENVLSIIGNGVVIHLESLFKEIDRCVNEWNIDDANERLKISDRAQIVFDFHQSIDGMQEQRKGKDMLGTTKKGIGPCYAAKADRSGLRICDLMTDNFYDFEHKYRKILGRTLVSWPELKDIHGSEEQIVVELGKYKKLKSRLEPMVIDTVNFVHNLIQKQNESLLIEGANATMLDIDYGTYPNVTSSNCSIGSACTGLSIPPQLITEVFGVTKAYCTRVGTGPFPTEQGENNGMGSAIQRPDLKILERKSGDINVENQFEVGEYLQRVGNEYGTTTKRARRCGWIDCVALNYANKINYFKAFAMTKLDVLDKLPKVAICYSYTILPKSMRYRSGELREEELEEQKENEKEGRGVEIDYFPADANILHRCKPNYIWMDGWLEDTTQIRNFEKLPVNAKKFILKCEEILNVPIKWIGVGPERDAMIIRD